VLNLKKGCPVSFFMFYASFPFFPGSFAIAAFRFLDFKPNLFFLRFTVTSRIPSFSSR
jgi:hypothetical protein